MQLRGQEVCVRLRGVHASGSGPVGASASDPERQPGACIPSSQCSLCNYDGGGNGEALAPASPATNRSIIQPCLFCPDY